MTDDIFTQEQTNTKTINNEIHMYKQARGRHCDTVISGLKFETKEETKTFISTIKKKFGIGGCQKLMEDINKDEPVFVFTGDLRDKIIKILVEVYNYDSKLIKKHG
jgi:translation initiation factor 1 (eIF-1/SUI1)